MEAAERIALAKSDKDARELFIEENTAFILKCAARSAGHFVDKSDDVFSDALAAFNYALTSYDENKGDFYAFAGVCIKNKITDFYRSGKRHDNVVLFSSLASETDGGEEKEFEVEDKNSGISETALEIYSLKAELEPFDISFFDLPSAAPKSGKTRSACVEAVHCIIDNRELLDYMYEKKALPVKQIMSKLKVSKKIFERHRKYLIMGVLILNGGYEILPGYFDFKNGRRE